MDAKLVRSQANLEVALKNAVSCHSAGRYKEAEQGYRGILKDHPDHPDALHLLGVLLSQTNDPQSGIPLIVKAVEARPNFPEALFNLGLIRQKLGQTYEATLAYTRAVHLEPTRALAWHNMSQCFTELGQNDAAISALEEGLSAAPKSEPLYDYACQLFKRENNLSACLDMADRGIQYFPNSARLWIHRSDACFALGRFHEGWEAYDWRNRASENPNISPSYPIPLWKGEELTGKSILVWTEQGPGETFLFSTMLDEVIKGAKKCIVVTTSRLEPILARSFPDAEIVDGVTYDVTPKTADVQSSLVDLGRALRNSWDDFPILTPHIKPDQDFVEEFSQHYKLQKKDSLVVGIAWRTFNTPTAKNKSLPLNDWRPILTVPGIEFVSLQYGDVKSEIEQTQAATGIEIRSEPTVDPVINLDRHLAQIANMDLVISTSNTTVHEAAAQGVPTWVLTPHTIGEGLLWPWFTDRADCPWYESLRFYRQLRHGDWRSPIVDVAIDLTLLSAKRSGQFSGSQHLLALALAYDQAKEPDAAMFAAEAAIRNGLKSIEAYRISARGLQHSSDLTKAKEVLSEAFDLGGSSVDLLVDRASVFRSLDMPADAIKDLEQALQIDPNQVNALISLARARRANGQLELGLESLQKAIELAPSKTSIKVSLGSYLSELGRHDEARSTFIDLMNHNEYAADAAYTLAMDYLLECNFQEGWPLLRYRLARSVANITYDHFPFPYWDGEDLTDKHVLTWTEQGIGEEILLSTMIDELAKRARTVTVLCSKRMLPLFKRSLRGVHVAERKLPLPSEALDPDIDIQMSLGDVGQVLRPSVDSFRMSRKKPALRANAQTSKKLAKKYRRSSSMPFLIGLSWHSTVPETGHLKSLDLDAARTLITKTPGTFVSLQYAPKPDHLTVLSEAGPERWVYDATVDPLVDVDLASAQVAAMNFVVTISNTTAHMAGALGIPTALLVPRHTARRWYWFKNQPVCLWYPSIQVYEADEFGKWGSAIEEVAEKIGRLVDSS